MCGGCAYRRGSEANTDIITRVKARISERLYAAFYCHEVGMGPGDYPLPGERKLCAGWVATVSRLVPDGPDWNAMASPESAEIRDHCILRAVRRFEDEMLQGGHPLSLDYQLDSEASHELARLIDQEVAAVAAAR